MLDVKWIRENPAAFDAALKNRGLPPLSAEVLALDRKRRDAQTEAQAVQQEGNRLSKEIGQAKGRGLDAAPLLAQAAALKARQAALEEAMRAADAELDRFLAVVPNAPHESVPVGADEHGNEVVRRSGPVTAPDFAPKQHFELGEALGLMDFDQAGVIAGARFTILKGALARLERALGQFMLDIHTTQFGYTEVSPPLLVRDKALYGTANLPKFKDDLFRANNINLINETKRRRGMPTTVPQLAETGNTLSDINAHFSELVQHLEAALDSQHWLIPTAEVPLTNLVAGKLLEEKHLPLRFAALTPCFRSEAGAAGKDTRGMLRQHQFYKVELVSIAHPDKSWDEHEYMTAAAEEVLKRLGLPYRAVLLCTGDMGFASRKTYDLEVWLPGQNAYREISSCSNCGDFQARRMDARFRPAGQKGTRYVHTLNGSGIAVGRALIAVLENYQRADGSIAIPEALQPYMAGRKSIGPHA